VTEYQQSGLSQTAFCREKKICAKGLNRYQRKVVASQAKAGFVQAKRLAPKVTLELTKLYKMTY